MGDTNVLAFAVPEKAPPKSVWGYGAETTLGQLRNIDRPPARLRAVVIEVGGFADAEPGGTT